MLVIFVHFRGDIDSTYTNLDSIRSVIVLWIKNGSAGVSLFLVLSAFLFTVISKGGLLRINYKKSLYNRIIRIFPLLTVVFLIVICIDRQNSSPIDVLRLIFLQLNTGHEYTGWGHSVFPVGPIWTIAVEFQFYLLFPLLLVLQKSNGGIRYLMGLCCFLLFIKCLIIGLNGPDQYYNLYHSLIGRLDQFLVGMIAGLIYLNDRYVLLIKRYAFLFLLVALLALTAYFACFNLLAKAISGFQIEAVLFAICIVAYLSIELPANKLGKMLTFIQYYLAILGRRSFSIYLLHLMIGTLTLKVYRIEINSELLGVFLNVFLLVLPATLLISEFSYRYIEKPFLNMKARYLES